MQEISAQDQFASLLARMNFFLVSQGAEITAPDSLVADSGEAIPVDATIRFVSTEIEALLAVVLLKEQSGRKSTWLEDLGALKNELALDCLIAISVEPFSASEKKQALAKGVVLRQMKEITDYDMGTEWLKIDAHEFLEDDFTARSFKMAFNDNSAVDMDFITQSILAEVDRDQMKAVIAYDGETEITLAELAQVGWSEDIPDDGTEIVKALTFDFHPDRLFVHAGGEEFPLSRLKLTVAYKKSKKEKRMLAILGGGANAKNSASPRAQAAQESGDGKAGYIMDVFVKTVQESTTEAN